MAMTQMRLIQSLGDAMVWFEREVAWGVPTKKLHHLCGQIGELYVAMLSNGQMATDKKQHGYDAVSAANERIFEKTTAQNGLDRLVTFNPQTLAGRVGLASTAPYAACRVARHRPPQFQCKRPAIPSWDWPLKRRP
jgi:hypothetical protein